MSDIDEYEIKEALERDADKLESTLDGRAEVKVKIAPYGLLVMGHNKPTDRFFHFLDKDGNVIQKTMSDTPETDHVIKYHEYGQLSACMQQHARKMERERDEAREIAEEGRLGHIPSNRKFPWENEGRETPPTSNAEETTAELMARLIKEAQENL